MFSTFSVHYPSITEYKFGRPATDAYHLYEAPVMLGMACKIKFKNLKNSKNSNNFKKSIKFWKLKN